MTPLSVFSTPCRERDFSAPWMVAWRERLAAGAPPLTPEKEATWGKVWEAMEGRWLHRKLWEWCSIAQALDERGFLRPGMRGMGFAVGEEPLSSLFASRGCSIIASDYTGGRVADGWAASGELAGSLDSIHWPGLIDEESFRARVEFQDVDMNKVADLPPESVDFLWSACSLEHLGGLMPGLEYILHATQLLRPGGVAVHTTEYNVGSNTETAETRDAVIYRRSDIESLSYALRRGECGIEGLDFDAGTDPHDLAYDVPPYYDTGRQHVKIALMGQVSTSILLVIRKGGARPG